MCAAKPLDIVIYPADVLSTPAAPVKDFDDPLRELLDRMAITMYAASGVGIAAPQVNVSIRAAVIDVSEDGAGRYYILNPRIAWKDGEMPSEEGCLSIPGYRDSIQRSERIVVEAQNEFGKEIEIRAEGLEAVCLQHEIDHLDGVLFVDHLSRLKKDLFKRWLKKRSEA